MPDFSMLFKLKLKIIKINTLTSKSHLSHFQGQITQAGSGYQVGSSMVAIVTEHTTGQHCGVVGTRGRDMSPLMQLTAHSELIRDKTRKGAASQRVVDGPLNSPLEFKSIVRTFITELFSGSAGKYGDRMHRNLELCFLNCSLHMYGASFLFHGLYGILSHLLPLGISLSLRVPL